MNYIISYHIVWALARRPGRMAPPARRRAPWGAGRGERPRGGSAQVRAYDDRA